MNALLIEIERLYALIEQRENGEPGSTDDDSNDNFAGIEHLKDRLNELQELFLIESLKEKKDSSS